MMSNIEMISNIIDDKFKNDDISKLEETEVSMSIEFVSDKLRFISFSLDKQPNEKVFPFFNRGLSGVCLMCDYIIFSEYKGKLFVLLIELKKGKDNVMKQLNAGECFVNYVVNTLNRVYDINVIPEIRKIAIRGSHIKIKGKPQKQKVIKYDENNFHTFQDNKFWLKKYLV